jgi:hypothetical protein
MTRRSRHRLRIVLLTVFCLLFQQVALAAYLCPIEQMPAQMPAMTEHCAGMAMAQIKADPALCDKHCNPDHQLLTDAGKLTVPPLALPASAFAPVFVPSVAVVGMPDDVPIARSDPPPRLRYCSLLI